MKSNFLKYPRLLLSLRVLLAFFIDMLILKKIRMEQSALGECKTNQDPVETTEILKGQRCLRATVPVLRACLYSRPIKPAGQQRPRPSRVTTSASPPFSHDPNYQLLPSRSSKQWAYFSRYFTAVDGGDVVLMLLSSTQDLLEDTDTEEGRAIMRE